MLGTINAEIAEDAEVMKLTTFLAIVIGVILGACASVVFSGGLSAAQNAPLGVVIKADTMEYPTNFDPTRNNRMSWGPRQFSVPGPITITATGANVRHQSTGGTVIDFTGTVTVTTSATVTIQ